MKKRKVDNAGKDKQGSCGDVPAWLGICRASGRTEVWHPGKLTAMVILEEVSRDVRHIIGL
jgi:hypothetical protein